MAVDVSQQWTQPNGESLLPSRWNDLELAKNKGLDNDDSNGRCLGWRCLAWVRCQNHKDMIHTMFGGNRNGNGSGRATVSKVSLLTGAANFDAETFHPDPSNVWYGQCVLAFSFILRAGDGSRYKFKCVLVSTLEEYVCRDDPIPGQSQCIMWCCIVFQSRADKILCSVAGNWLFKSESRRLYEMDAQLPRLYVIPMTSLLGKLSVVRAGNTGTIPYSMQGRAAECYPGGKCDSSEGKGDGSLLYYVNPWTMRWSQII